ncbi:hypothetical protein HMPREF9380_1343 [Streptococcus sanguinis SK49]|uniref:Uncharacterized protein n=1 Tax=Streptococcus sanguinis SK49 TaxID=888808 RepID=F3UXW6_STRSA|nr:hypothetical protein HMPREF9380_1343 [Streptococcus sanguinis SK49]
MSFQIQNKIKEIFHSKKVETSYLNLLKMAINHLALFTHR